MKKLIITAAVVGSGPTKAKNPAVPYTPAEIAGEAVNCWRAGAAVAHIHVRHTESGAPSMDVDLFQEVVSLIRTECDMLINLTTSGLDMQGEDVIEQRLAPVKLTPELCSLDIGSVNFRERVFVNPPAWGVLAAECMRAVGVKPEIEVFDTGHIAQAQSLIDDGLTESPPYYQLCMGVGWGIQATPENLHFMHSKLPPRAIWSVLEIARALGGDYELKIQVGYPPMHNHIETADLIKTVAGDLLGDEKIIPPEPDMGTDDFGFFLKETKVEMFMLGCKIEGDTRRHHDPRFDVDENCMPIGAAIFAETALRILDQSDK